jgi:hypothetical protein
VLSAVEACADGASRATIFFRSHTGLSIGMPYLYQGAFFAPLMYFFFLLSHDDTTILAARGI